MRLGDQLKYASSVNVGRLKNPNAVMDTCGYRQEYLPEECLNTRSHIGLGIGPHHA